MKPLFTRKTFRYFDVAKKNNKKKAWFEKNRQAFEVDVREPFAHLLAELDRRIGPALPRIAITPRKISRPLRSKSQAEKAGLVRASIMFYLSEKQTSMFEWNPGLFMQLGDEKIDNVIGLGLYSPSSRQIKRLRRAFVQDHATVKRILSEPKLRKYWGAPAPERYVRFPKDYSPDVPGAEYLWYKQFFLRRQFTRKEVTSKAFADTVLSSFEAGLPLLAWIRNAIGVYDKRQWELDREDERARKEHPTV